MWKQVDNKLNIQFIMWKTSKKNSIFYKHPQFVTEILNKGISKYLHLILFNIIVQYKPFYRLNRSELYQVKEKHT